MEIRNLFQNQGFVFGIRSSGLKMWNDTRSSVYGDQKCDSELGIHV